MSELPRPGKEAWLAKESDRPPFGWWAPGKYIVQCVCCGDFYVGDKRSGYCADCAYSGEANMTHAPRPDHG